MFHDVAEQAGLWAFTHTDGSSGRKFFVEQMGAGVAVFDYDNDGWPDIYLVSGGALKGYRGPKPSNRLFRNRRDGTFEDVTERAGVGLGRYCIGVAAADFDNDGHVDLYVTCFGPNVLLRNNGDGTFRDVTASAGVSGGEHLSSSAAWGDFDGDGYLDLYVCNYVQYQLEKDLWCSKFAGQKSYCGPNLYKPEVHRLFRNNGNGTFTDVTERSGISKEPRNGLGVVWLDYNGDGRMDIFVADDQSPNLLWRNNGDGTFTDVALELGVALSDQGNAQAGMGVDVGDYDNDGLVDITVTNFSEESNSLYHHEKNYFREMSFLSGMGSATLMYLGFGCGFLDYDLDGRLDLFFANGHVLDDIESYSDSVKWKQPSQLFKQVGGGKFSDVSRESGIFEGVRVGRGSAFGDLFNRGRTDIVLNALRGHPVLWRNDTTPGAHWLELDLKASWGNPQAIGAVVMLKAGGLVQRRDVKSAGSYASSMDVRPLFGLGSAARVEELVIVWPSGQRQVVPVSGVDRILKVVEPPEGVPAARRAGSLRRSG